MNEQPYLASEDSALLRDVLKRYRGESCLEIGAGNGGNLVVLAGRFRNVVGTDLVRPSMRDWNEKGTDFVLADGSTCLRDSSFDLVAFNPPYLKETETGDRAVEGGENLEVPKKFLEDALRVVRPGGKIVMLLNDESDLPEFEHEVTSHGFHFTRVADKRLFFEELAVYEATAVQDESRKGTRFQK